eukprot:COSAG05_NODE_5646_length_1123_cov_0.930664_1_plen_154_part_10
MSANAKLWKEFAQTAISTVPVRHVKGTERLVGLGIMQLGRDIWNQARDFDPETNEQIDMGNYVNFLIKPVFAKLDEIKKHRALDDIASMLIIFDTVRSIPFVVSGYTPAKLEDAFRRFCDVVALDGSANPDVAAVQYVMVSEGWAMLCFTALFS